LITWCFICGLAGLVDGCFSSAFEVISGIVAGLMSRWTEEMEACFVGDS